MLRCYEYKYNVSLNLRKPQDQLCSNITEHSDTCPRWSSSANKIQSWVAAHTTAINPRLRVPGQDLDAKPSTRFRFPNIHSSINTNHENQIHTTTRKAKKRMFMQSLFPHNSSPYSFCLSSQEPKRTTTPTVDPPP